MPALFHSYVLCPFKRHKVSHVPLSLQRCTILISIAVALLHSSVLSSSLPQFFISTAFPLNIHSPPSPSHCQGLGESQYHHRMQHLVRVLRKEAKAQKLLENKPQEVVNPSINLSMTSVGLGYLFAV